MTEQQTVAPAHAVDEFDRKSIALTADFIAAAIDDASILDGIPPGAVLVLLPDDDPAFVDESIALGVAAIRQGRDVVFRHSHEARSETKPDRCGPSE